MKKQANRRRASKKAIPTSSHLHLSQHKHTGHILPRRATSYPMLVMIVLSVGVLLFGYTRYVTADSGSGSYSVNASVPGPPPTTAATIDSPLDGATVSSQPLTVSGSCPVDTYVELFRNNFFSGVALCDGSGQWSLSTGLFAGGNALKARVFNYTDVAGPDSNVVNVTFGPAGSSHSGSSGGTSGSSGAASGSGSGATENGPSTSTLLLKTDYLYQGVYVGDPLNWTLNVQGGQPPYSLDIDWGDSQRSLLGSKAAGDVTVSHTYKKAGGYKGSYVVKIVISDAFGNQSLLQLLAIINNRPVGGGVTNIGNTSGLGSITGGSLEHGLQYIWPTYGIVVLMLVSFWLGERQEFRRLSPRLKRLRHS